MESVWWLQRNKGVKTSQLELDEKKSKQKKKKKKDEGDKFSLKISMYVESGDIGILNIG
jgi:hypothetical protein